MLLSLLLASSLASAGTAATFLPSAEPQAAGTGEVGLGATGMFAGWGGGAGILLAGYGHANVALADRFSLGCSIEGGTIGGHFPPSSGEGALGGSAAARVLLVTGPKFNLAAFGGAFVEYGVSSMDLQPAGFAGLAVEGGGDVRFDASVPVVFLPINADVPSAEAIALESLIAVEAGVSWRKSPKTTLRIGKGLGWAVSAKWKRDLGPDGWYAEWELQAPVLVGAMGRFEVGRRF